MSRRQSQVDRIFCGPENVMVEMEKVTSVATPGDYAYIQYSGDGTLSLTKAEEYREPSGSDAVLVPHDRKTQVRYLC